TIIYVSIIPYNAAGNATTCSEESFTTEALIPNCTTLVSPANNDANVSVSTAISWNAIANATGYFLNIGTTAGGTDIVFNEDIGNITTYYPLSDLPENTTIYIAVIPYNSQGAASGCHAAYFTTENLAIVIPSVFTPNGDGYNDTWSITDPNNEIKTVYVFDRYGKLLKTFVPNSQGWNGEFNNIPSIASDYWYLIEFQNGKQSKGHFSLKR
ncbi:T9SS type B sorting domain-containing protein, partial [Oceanihabitans sp. 2_MG-2023]|uniref:T9SS type B sorting domain-containing protein n=1 Tax=Oceanihabitans sp. 2_MG-2023 TaxID=3062661 RepID=UPI0026E43B43